MDISIFLHQALQVAKTHLYQLKANQPCAMCAEPSMERICSNCEAYWPLQEHHCQRCSLPLAHHALYCGECLRHPPVFEQSHVPYLYDHPLSDLILAFKNQRDYAVGMALSDHWQKRIKHIYMNQHLSYPDALAPVPIHWRKQWQRGFNQTQFFAERLGRSFSIPLLKKAKMRRISDGQKNQSRAQRLKLLSSAFEVSNSLENKTIAIVDDVMTTGATANAFAKTLKNAGAKAVIVWALARTPKYRHARK